MNRDFVAILRAVGFALAIAVSLFGSAGATKAEGFTAEQRSACTPDAFRLCASEMPNVRAITAWMRRTAAA
jgi:hypothetical protein